LSNGPAFLLGWIVGLVVVGLIVLAVSDAGDVDSNDDSSAIAALLKLALGLLLIVLAGKQWRGRPKEGEEAEVPKWMQAIDAVTPLRALGLGGLLSGVNPKNLALTLGAALVIAQAGLSTGDTAWALAVFVIIAS
jgi:threonine/homoserine/homoserine lactone efflux protein